MTKLQGLIFDVDGTLADTEEVHRLAFNAAFSDFGLKWEWSRELYADLLSVSGGRERIQFYAETRGHDSHCPDDPSAFAAEIHQAKTAHYQRMLRAAKLRLRPGIERLLAEARSKRIRLAIATSSARANVEALLNNILGKEALAWFDVIATCDVIAKKKPSPAVYQYTLAQLALDANVCMAIEDTQNGNMAALAAGMKTLITTHSFTRNQDFTGASLVLDHLGEPDRSFTVIAGNAHGARFIDVALLRSLNAEKCAPIAQEAWGSFTALAGK
ncbi:MAG: HAD-IA family hydrolase [Gammaproteobacteria bacterium]|nr:HAD-IA family hydrolase [Gammaproteobacteria bacterium]MCI0591597.1 HAD-IA family hydrolase [Gammaproteobacteria bacterium]